MYLAIIPSLSRGGQCKSIKFYIYVQENVSQIKFFMKNTDLIDRHINTKEFIISFCVVKDVIAAMTF